LIKRHRKRPNETKPDTPNQALPDKAKPDTPNQALPDKTKGPSAGRE